MKLYYLPYHMKSMSVRELQEVLGGLKIKPDGHYAFAANHLVVNWGHGNCPYWGGAVAATSRLVNHWSNVAVAVNKLSTFKKLKEANVPTPAWTTERTKAQEWVNGDHVVFCRTKLTGMEGKGIVVATKSSELVDAPLYTRLFSKDKEYRVHVFDGQVIDYVQKKLKQGAKEIAGRNKYIRNTVNGWIFCRGGVNPAESVLECASKAVSALGLNFGAVDLATSDSGKVAVFEVNTAPGIEGSTIAKYADAIKSYKSKLENAQIG